MPTLRLITSSSQRRLLDTLADNISASPLLPLEKECIVILSPGMARWISMELASTLGVSAGLEFSFPNDLLDKSFRSVLPEMQSSLPFTHSSLTWRIASQLPDLSRLNGFEQIATYLGDGRDDRRLLQISKALADCFDQYTIFRPETVLAWDDGDDNDWQAQLWRAINRDCPGSHRATLLKALHHHVSSNAPPSGSSTLPRRVSLFGISYLPPFHLEALRLLSSYCEVTCYLLNPCGQYWGTIISEKKRSRITLQPAHATEAEEYYETGNPLLSSLGTLGQEFFETLLEFGFEAEELDSAPEAMPKPAEAESPTILSTIQNDILTLYDRPSYGEKRSISTDDRSLQIHACHGALREMEILYDNLLAAFDELPSLEPRHIVVMIPDIETYAPYISSVFANRSSGRPQIPYTIADRSIRRESPFVDAFLKVLSTAQNRFALHEILDLLETTAVMSRFGLDEEELVNIRAWVTDCGVRWGLDGDHRTDLGFPHYTEFSWQAGLDRLFLGYAMTPDENSTVNAILPYPACSGQRAETLGKLTEFITVIREINLRLSASHFLPEWADIFTETCASMLLADVNDSGGPLVVDKALNTLREASSLYGFKQPLAFDAVRDHLTEAVARSGSGYGFMGGAVTFCAMLPMRSIPMRVVWLAGMSDGQFPRTERPSGFSLMNGPRRRGDRSLRDEDRYLFLEALMAAEDRFCISYKGQSDRDNCTLPPSVLVAELLDYVSKGFVGLDGISPASITIRHRMQGFSSFYFDGHDPVHFFSYDRESCQSVEARRTSGRSDRMFIGEPLAVGIESALQIDLQQLVRFLANPAASFLEQRLHVTPFRPAEEADDAEPFSLDALSRYTLSQELVSQILKGAPYDECLSAARSRGALPPLAAGKSAFDTIWEKSRQFAAALEPQLGSPLEPLAITFTANGVQLHALLENCREGVHTRWRCAGMKGKDRLALWLDHLLLNVANADGYPLRSMMLANDAVLELPPLEHSPAILSDLLELYYEGMKRPLRFFPETSWHLLKEGQQKAEISWRGDQRLGLPGECNNQAVLLCFGAEEPWGEELNALAERIYGPLIAKTEPK
ncbi:MAG: exodeoxyribonuclease V subunit gamma [Desulfuromonadaceae bacterium]|nr:exodeoxyribonuclease V subunit gamma [Desulfuromonadaceae bacterium]MDD2849374.1 exodeoxyribonuclease V subunit gamma [Desulfuromonadaceae bacterium]MDD4129433.1 exodeoxyribonuclease V subunit gamma [Desulfuromonadaceae bacterium]